MKLNKIDRQITFKLPTYAHEGLQDLSIRSCKKMSPIIRQALEGYIERNKHIQLIKIPHHETDRAIPVSFMATPSMYEELNKMSYKTDRHVKTLSAVVVQALIEHIELHKEQPHETHEIR